MLCVNKAALQALGVCRQRVKALLQGLSLATEVMCNLGRGRAGPAFSLRCKDRLTEHLVLALGPEKQSSAFVGHCGEGAPTTSIALPTTIINVLTFDTQVLPAACCMPVRNKCKL